MATDYAALIASRLKAAREELEMTLEMAAQLAGFNNYQTLSSIEKGERSVKVAELAQFAGGAGHPVGLLLAGVADAGDAGRSVEEGCNRGQGQEGVGKIPEIPGDAAAGRGAVQGYLRSLAVRQVGDAGTGLGDDFDEARVALEPPARPARPR